MNTPTPLDAQREAEARYTTNTSMRAFVCGAEWAAAALAAPPVPAEPAYMFQIGETYETQNGKRVTVEGRTAVYITCSDRICRYDRKSEPADAGRVTGTDHDYSCPDNFKRADRPTPPKEQAA